MLDFHVHTRYSKDSNLKMEDAVIEAIDKKLEKIVFTDHIDFDLNDEYEFEYEKRKNEIDELKERYGKKIKIVNGVEIGIDIKDLNRVNEYLNIHPFDFKIMSIHNVNGHEIYKREIFKMYSPKHIMMMYLDELLYAVTNFNDYDVIGHIDFIRRYDKNIADFNIDDYLQYYELILKEVIKNGKAIEINTSSLIYGDDYFYPEEKIIELYAKLGGKKIAIGSDTHFGGTINLGFDEALEFVKKYKLELIK